MKIIKKITLLVIILLVSLFSNVILNVIATSSHQCTHTTYEKELNNTFTGGELEGGYYYLNCNIQLSDNITINNETHICLNGYVLNTNGNSIISHSKLYINDCKHNDTNIKYYFTSLDKVVDVNLKGLWKLSNTLTDNVVYGGLITNTSSTECVSIVSYDELYISNINMCGCYSANISFGGAITCDNSNCYIFDSNFYGNSSYNNGGALYLTKSEAYITNSNFKYNVSSNGGAIWNNKLLNIIDCKFYSNSSGSTGGAITNEQYQLTQTQVVHGSISISNSTFTSNSSITNGGAIYNKGVVTLEDTSITNNIAGLNGAGVFDDSLSGCLPAGTVVTMADNTTKNIEDIEVGDVVKTYDHETGTLSSSEVYYVFSESNYKAIQYLYMSDNNNISFVDEHAFLIQESLKYELITEYNKDTYIGKHIYNAITNSWVEVVNASTNGSTTDYYSFITTNHLNAITDNYLSCDDESYYMLNAFDLISDTSLQYDSVKKQNDINLYGTYTISDVDYCTLEEFDAYQMKYIPIVLAKKLVDSSYLKALRIKYATVDTSAAVYESMDKYNIILGSNNVIKNNLIKKIVNNSNVEFKSNLYLNGEESQIQYKSNSDNNDIGLSASYVGSVSKLIDTEDYVDFFSMDNENYEISGDEDGGIYNYNLVYRFKYKNYLASQPSDLVFDTILSDSNPLYSLDANTDYYFFLTKDIEINSTVTLPGEMQDLYIYLNGHNITLTNGAYFKTEQHQTLGFIDDSLEPGKIIAEDAINYMFELNDITTLEIYGPTIENNGICENIVYLKSASIFSLFDGTINVTDCTNPVNAVLLEANNAEFRFINGKIINNKDNVNSNHAVYFNQNEGALSSFWMYNGSISGFDNAVANRNLDTYYTVAVFLYGGTISNNTYALNLETSYEQKQIINIRLGDKIVIKDNTYGIYYKKSDTNNFNLIFEYDTSDYKITNNMKVQLNLVDEYGTPIKGLFVENAESDDYENLFTVLEDTYVYAKSNIDLTNPLEPIVSYDYYISDKRVAYFDKTVQEYEYDGLSKSFNIINSVLDGYTVKYYQAGELVTNPSETGLYDVRITRDSDEYYNEVDKYLINHLIIGHKCNNNVYGIIIDSTFNKDKLYSGKYYLEEDYTLTSSWAINSGETVYICLNGHTLDISNWYINVWGTLYISDCCNDEYNIKYFTCDNDNCNWKLTTDITPINLQGGLITRSVNRDEANSSAFSIQDDGTMYVDNVNFAGFYNSTDGSIFSISGVVTIKNSNFYGNKSDSMASCFDLKGGLNIFNSTFKYNKANKAGVINYHNPVPNSGLLIDGCLFEYNNAGETSVIYLNNTSAIIVDTTIKNNTSTSEGAISVYYTNNPSCLAEGTKILMADGSYKNVEDIHIGDIVKTINHNTGNLVNKEIFSIFKSQSKSSKLTLLFEDENSLSICGEHSLLEKDSLKYVKLSINNIEDYIGKYFYNAVSSSWVKLVNYTYSNNLYNSYSIMAKSYINVIADEMATVSADSQFMLNVFDLDEDLSINQTKKLEDISTYGLATYDDFKNVCLLNGITPSLDVFNKFNIKYAYIVMGKGVATLSELLESFNINQNCIIEEELLPLFTFLSLYKTYDSYSKYDVDSNTLLLGSNVIIQDNKIANDVISNVYFPTDTSRISVIDGATGINVGVTTYENKCIFMEGINYNTYKDYFTSDRKAYQIGVTLNSQTKKYDYSTIAVYKQVTNYVSNITLSSDDLSFDDAKNFFNDEMSSLEFGETAYIIFSKDDTKYNILVYSNNQKTLGTSISISEIDHINNDYYIIGTYSDEFSITFNTDSGTWKTGYDVVDSYHAGDVFALPSSDKISKSNYNFVGWYDNSSFTGNAISSIGVVNHSNLTLYAKWDAKNTISINEDAQSFVLNTQNAQFKLLGTNKDSGNFVIKYYINNEWTTTVPTLVGSYNVSITRAEDNDYQSYSKEITNGFVIYKIKVNEPTIANKYTYTGTTITPTISGVESYMTPYGDISAVNPGIYTITYTLSDEYEWNDGSDGIVKWEIKAISITPKKDDTTKDIVILNTDSGFTTDISVTVEITLEQEVSNKQLLVNYFDLPINNMKLTKTEHVGVIYDVKLIQTINDVKTVIQPEDIAPGTIIKVKLLIPEDININKISRILHVHSASDITEIEFDKNNIDSEGYYEIETDSFSEFAIIYKSGMPTWLIVLICLFILIIVAAIVLYILWQKEYETSIQEYNVERKLKFLDVIFIPVYKLFFKLLKKTN